MEVAGMFKTYQLSTCLLSLLILTAPFQSWSLESTESFSGELIHVVEDDFTNHKSKSVFYVKDDKTKKQRKLEFDKGAIPDKLQLAPSGSRIKIRGKKKSNQAEDIMLVDDSGDAGVIALDVTYPTDVYKGIKKVLAVKVDFADEPAIYDEATIYKLVFDPNNPTSSKNFYITNSQNNLDITGEVAKVKLSVNATATCSTSLSSWTSEAESLLIKAGYSLGAFTQIQYFLPSYNILGCSFAGRGYLPGKISWVVAPRIKTISHELGHNFGLHHASDDTYEYGDRSDSMGVPQTLVEFNAPHKDQMGWIPNEKLINLSSNGTFRVSPLNMDSNSAPYPQAYKIPRPAGGNFYISFRDQSGDFDDALISVYSNRLNIHHYKKPNIARTYFLTALGSGGSYILDGTSYRVNMISQNSNYIEFSITDSSTNPTDTTAPNVSLTSPSNGASFNAGSTVSATATATDNVGVTKVEFFVSGTLKCSDTTSPYSCSFAMPTGSNIPVKARAFDAAGNSKESAISYISNSSVDSTAPNVSLTSPSNGAEFAAGSTVVASASASDNVGVTQVRFYVAGALKCSDSTAPYSCSFSMPSGPNISVMARAYDAAGNYKDSASVSISNPQSVDTEAPSIPQSVAVEAKRKNGAVVSFQASTDNVGVSHYIILQNGSSIGTTSSTSYSVGKLPTGEHSFQVIAVDQAGNKSAASASAKLTVDGNTNPGGGGKGKGRKK
jgi:hypothetical protein